MTRTISPQTAPSAYNPADIVAFADRLRTVENRVTIAAAISALGLMRPQWSLRLVVWLRTKVLGMDANLLWRALLTRFPTVADEILEGAAKWAVDGRDLYDQRSVGGFCQAELNAMHGLLIIDEGARGTQGIPK